MIVPIRDNRLTNIYKDSKIDLTFLHYGITKCI